MKFAVGGMLLLMGAMLPGGVHAVETNAAGGLSQLAAQPVPATAKQNTPLPKRKGRAVGKAGAKKADSRAPEQQESAKAIPPAATDQSVQLRGVRG